MTERESSSSIDRVYDLASACLSGDATPEEQRLINGLVDGWNDAEQHEILGVDQWIDGLTGRDAIQEAWTGNRATCGTNSAHRDTIRAT